MLLEGSAKGAVGAGHPVGQRVHAGDQRPPPASPQFHVEIGAVDFPIGIAMDAEFHGQGSLIRAQDFRIHAAELGLNVVVQRGVAVAQFVIPRLAADLGAVGPGTGIFIVQRGGPAAVVPPVPQVPHDPGVPDVHGVIGILGRVVSGVAGLGPGRGLGTPGVVLAAAIAVKILAKDGVGMVGVTPGVGGQGRLRCQEGAEVQGTKNDGSLHGSIPHEMGTLTGFRCCGPDSAI